LYDFNRIFYAKFQLYLILSSLLVNPGMLESIVGYTL